MSNEEAQKKLLPQIALRKILKLDDVEAVTQSKRPKIRMHQTTLKNLDKTTDYDKMVDIATDATKHAIKTYSSKNSSRPAEQELFNGYDRYYKLFDGKEIDVCDCRKDLNYAQKINSGGRRMNYIQSIHVLWCQGQGDKTVHVTGSKMLPTQAAESMRLKGTIEGEHLFPNDPYMKANLSGCPTFQWLQQLSKEQLKGYMSKPRVDLQKQSNSLKDKEMKQTIALAAARSALD